MKLTLDEILGPDRYERIRDDFRRYVMLHKRARRVALGDQATLVFEDRVTLRFQVEEMVRAEAMRQPEQIQAELDVYNALMPGSGELSATLFIEIERSAEIRTVLHDLVGLDEHLVLIVGDRRIPARFEAGRQEAERIASVQYVRFPVGDPEPLLDPAVTVAIESTHPAYPARVVLAAQTRDALAADLRAD